MRTWILVGSLAAGVLLYVYEWYNSRTEQGYGDGYNGRGPRAYHAGDFSAVNETTPEKVPEREPPSPDDKCSICLDPLIMKTEGKKYSIIALHCGHWFHQRCALRLLEYHPHCPVCRLEIDRTALRNTPVRVADSGDTVAIVDGEMASTSWNNKPRQNRD